MARHAPRLAAAVSIALACLPVPAAQRAFVSSTGNDANAPAGCTPALPCRTFQAAHDAVDAGGEIVALDTAGFGAVTISKSVAIIGNPGAIASIAVASGNGVTIATPGVNVTLRNLNINGVGGVAGISMSEGNSLTIENCVVSNFAGAQGVYFVPTGSARLRIAGSILRGNGTGAYIAGTASADIVGSQFMGNASVGLQVEQTLNAVTNVAVSDSVASGNGYGFAVRAFVGTARLALIRATASSNAVAGFQSRAQGASATSVMTVGSSMATMNGGGFSNNPASGGTAIFESLGNSVVRQNNNFATLGTITPVPGF
jgi:hypothetical protein